MFILPFSQKVRFIFSGKGMGNPIRIFTVVSPHIRDYDSIKTQVLDFFRDSKYKAYIVEERGKNNTHPHLNVIWSTDLHKKYFSQKLKEHFKAPNSNERLLKHKTVFNEAKLKDDYLSKEANAKVLFDSTQQINAPEVINKMLDEIQAIKRARARKQLGNRPEFAKSDSAPLVLLGPKRNPNNYFQGKPIPIFVCKEDEKRFKEKNNIPV